MNYSFQKQASGCEQQLLEFENLMNELDKIMENLENFKQVNMKDTEPYSEECNNDLEARQTSSVSPLE